MNNDFSLKFTFKKNIRFTLIHFIPTLFLILIINPLIFFYPFLILISFFYLNLDKKLIFFKLENKFLKYFTIFSFSIVLTILLSFLMVYFVTWICLKFFNFLPFDA